MTIAPARPDFARLARHRYTFRSLGLQWSGYPGALLHGGMGMMLARSAPDTFAALMGNTPEAASGPRPWWMLPPTDPRIAYAPGDDFTLDLFFANPTPSWATDCGRALEALGRAGIGRSRGRFLLVAQEPVPWDPARDDDEPLTLDSMLQSARPTRTVRHLGVQLLTPLRVKADQGLLSHAPDAATLAQRTLARAAMLSGQRVCDLPLATQALDEAAALRITEQELHWDDITRYSARQRANVPLGGLTGWLHYRGNAPLDALFAWLSVGEWLHAGSKTTFGLGAYRLIPGRTAPPHP